MEHHGGVEREIAKKRGVEVVATVSSSDEEVTVVGERKGRMIV